MVYYWLVVRHCASGSDITMIDYAEIARRLMDNKKVSNTKLRAYFARRHTNPVIQWQWEALTTITPASDGSRYGVIRFPNGSTLEFERPRII
jgi:hypothetical protein